MIKNRLGFILIFILCVCGKEKDDTAWSLKDLENSLAYVPATTVNYPSGDMNPPTPCYSCKPDFKHETKTISEKGFYISKYEVSNGQYLQFIYDLRKQGKEEEFKACLPDTLLWQTEMNEAYVEYYFRHPVYRQYPVDAITYEEAQKFCAWLTERYMKEPSRKFKSVVFELPTVKQWYVAAMGGSGLADFPWKGPLLKNKKGENMANYLQIREQSIYREQKTGKLQIDSKTYNYPDTVQYNGWIMKDIDITCPVQSFWPNDYGLYNMAGNVEEFVQEKGISKGGSYKDPAYYLQNFVEEQYDTLHSSSVERGFRFIMEVIN